MSVSSALMGNITGALGNIERAVIMFPENAAGDLLLEEDDNALGGGNSMALKLVSQKLNSNKLGNKLAALDEGIREMVKGNLDGKK